MSYVLGNPRTKRQVKEMMANGGIFKNDIFNPGLGGPIPDDGTVFLEGPHSPEPHRWYAVGTMKDGKLVSIK